MGSLNPLQMISQIALAAVTGGASMLLQVALKAVLSAVGEQIIQKLGDALGLPQAFTDLAKGAFNTAMGNASGASTGLGQAMNQLGEATGATPFETGQVQNQVQTATNQAASDIVAGAPEGEGASKSWLMAIAKAMGKILDSKAAQMSTLAGQVEKTPSKSAELQAVSQEFGIMMNALTTALKSVGEGASTLARKG